MAGEPVQNYENHRNFDKIYIGSGLTALAALVLAVIALIKGGPFIPWAIFAAAVTLMGLILRVRTYALKVQDRIIRLEMRLRLAHTLPADLQSRIGELTISQLIGLRFASDEEIGDLTRKVLGEKIARADDIKRLVKNWQADRARV